MPVAFGNLLLIWIPNTPFAHYHQWSKTWCGKAVTGTYPSACRTWRSGILCMIVKSRGQVHHRNPLYENRYEQSTYWTVVFKKKKKKKRKEEPFFCMPVSTHKQKKTYAFQDMLKATSNFWNMIPEACNRHIFLFDKKNSWVQNATDLTRTLPGNRLLKIFWKHTQKQKTNQSTHSQQIVMALQHGCKATIVQCHNKTTQSPKRCHGCRPTKTDLRLQHIKQKCKDICDLGISTWNVGQRTVQTR